MVTRSHGSSVGMNPSSKPREKKNVSLEHLLIFFFIKYEISEFKLALSNLYQSVSAHQWICHLLVK